MYIVVRDDVPSNYVPVVCAHAALSAYHKNKEDAEVIEWMQNSFKKVVCKVSNEAFEQCKNLERSVIITESSLGNQEVACVLLPRENFPKFVKFLPLYKYIE